eukprot:9062990-Pyramimonas_sp.AAC.1
MALAGAHLVDDDTEVEENKTKQQRTATGTAPFDPWGGYKGASSSAASSALPLGPPPAIPPPTAAPEGLDPGAARLFAALSADFRNVMGETIRPLDAKVVE